MWTKNFWKDAAERAIKSAAQGALGVITGAAVTNAFDADWELVAGGALLMGIYSLLSSLASGAVNNGDGPPTPSLVGPQD